MKWTYRRGRWISYREYPDTPRSARAKEELKYWNLIRRARKVGMAVPEKWMLYGEPPISMIPYFGRVMDAIYLPAMSAMLNDESILWSRMKK